MTIDYHKYPEIAWKSIYLPQSVSWRRVNLFSSLSLGSG